MTTIEAALAKLKAYNEANELNAILTQVVFPPDPLSEIPTLDRNTYRPLTPMLAARFRFGGRWENAAASQIWLGLRDMRAMLLNGDVLSQIDRRIRNWPTASLGKFSKANISLFGIDQLDDEETYLLWGGKKEPAIAAYIGHEEKVFPNFRDYLLFLTKT